jgi:hypothetical protein
MYVRWLHRERRAGTSHSAVLVENVWIKGKPVQKHIASLAGIAEIDNAGIAARVKFWATAQQRLARLADRITPTQRRAIIKSIAGKVRLPSKAVREGLKVLEEENQQDLTAYTEELKILQKMIRKPDDEEVVGVIEGKERTIDDVKWRICELAHAVQTGGLGMLHLSPRQRLQQLSKSTGISLRRLQEDAETWRWRTERGEDGKTPLERYLEEEKDCT